VASLCSIRFRGTPVHCGRKLKQAFGVMLGLIRLLLRLYTYYIGTNEIKGGNTDLRDRYAVTEADKVVRTAKQPIHALYEKATGFSFCRII